MNDLIELHQNEIENLKTGISDMEEKVQYQSEERLNDLHELMESCQTRVCFILFFYVKVYNMQCGVEFCRL